MKSNVLMVALSAALLASCGSAGSGAPTQSTLGLTTTNYVTLLPTETTTTVAAVPGQPSAPGLHPEQGSYILTAADIYPSNVAKKFKVALADLLTANGLALDAKNQVIGWPAVGASIILPPGWTQPGTSADPAVTTATLAGGTTPPADTTAPGKTTTTIAGGVSTCKADGEYTILAEDTTRSKVATKLNTTVAALDAVNATTKGYKGFYPGLKIKVPAKTGC
jgi:LysM repeat protein